jgi:hypothetical protein
VRNIACGSCQFFDSNVFDTGQSACVSFKLACQIFKKALQSFDILSCNITTHSRVFSTLDRFSNSMDVIHYITHERRTSRPSKWMIARISLLPYRSRAKKNEKKKIALKTAYFREWCWRTDAQSSWDCHSFV